MSMCFIYYRVKSVCSRILITLITIVKSQDDCTREREKKDNSKNLNICMLEKPILHSYLKVNIGEIWDYRL